MFLTASGGCGYHLPNEIEEKKLYMFSILMIATTLQTFIRIGVDHLRWLSLFSYGSMNPKWRTTQNGGSPIS